METSSMPRSTNYAIKSSTPHRRRFWKMIKSIFLSENSAFGMCAGSKSRKLKRRTARLDPRNRPQMRRRPPSRPSEDLADDNETENNRIPPLPPSIAPPGSTALPPSIAPPGSTALPPSVIDNLTERLSNAGISYSNNNNNTVPEESDCHPFVDTKCERPITLKYIPSGLNLEDRVMWIQDDNENEMIPQPGIVKWIGKIRSTFYAGIQLDRPVGNSSGLYGYGRGLCVRLFTCKLPYGRFVPVKELVLYSDYHDTGIRAGIICVICRDDFLENYWNPEESLMTEISGEKNDPQNMVATKCGHLFHFGCLNVWLARRKENQKKACPYCQSEISGMEDLIRIYPTQS